MTFELFLLAVTVLYVSQVVLFTLAVRKPRDRTYNNDLLDVSIVVAARNEEQSIARCLLSLLGQSYPKERFEIIMVDDHSTDGTVTVARSLDPKGISLRILSSPKEDLLRGKTNALAHAIDQARGEIVMITDADCVVPETWIEETVKRYDSGVGIVGGMTVQRSDSPFGGMQSLDWTYLLGVAAASVSLGNPLSTIGNNLSFRRKAYEEVGGYRNIKFSVTEDYSLFQAIVRTGRWDYLYPIDPALLVLSEPCRNFRDLGRQKKRWGKGGLDMKLSGFLIMAIGFAEHAAIIVSPFLGVFALGAAAFLIKSLGDYVFLRTILSRLKKQSDLQYFHWFQWYYSLYVILLPFLVFLGGRVQWKGRSY